MGTYAKAKNTDFFSGVAWMFPSPVVVTIDDGYKVQFSSTDAGDGTGKTCTLMELDIIQRG